MDEILLIAEDENMTIDSYLEKSVCEKLRNTQMDMMTPLEAMNELYKLQEQAKKEAGLL